MKKLFFLTCFIAAAVVIGITSCQKEPLSKPQLVQETGNSVTERKPPISNPCSQSTTSEGGLAQKTGAHFGSGWKAGVLDNYANGCVLDNTFKSDCSSSSTATFDGLSEFSYGNFFTNSQAITPAQQTAIVDAALSYAYQNISCSGSIHINFIDFTLAPQGGIINFAVKYQCCDNGSGG